MDKCNILIFKDLVTFRSHINIIHMFEINVHCVYKNKNQIDFFTFYIY